MKKLSYLLFHLNLNFSSIKENQRSEIIKKCYHPILDIVESTGIPISIEAPARTIETIFKLDTFWINRFKNLINKRKCSFIGSGLNQIAGPTIPYEVNFYNLKIGNSIYKKILGIKPSVALVNEMAYSEGLAEIYLKNDYKTIILDIDSIEWKTLNKNKFFKKFPNQCYSSWTKDKKINILWSSSRFFQRFQNCVYRDISVKKYINFIKQSKELKKINLPIYCGDAEIFNFRPGRFLAERRIDNYDEWKKLKDILIQVKNEVDLVYSLPEEIIRKRKKNVFSSSLTTAAFPILVKKQTKYNITRWSVTGRNDQKINTLCYKFYEIIRKKYKKKLKYYEILLDLWSSDFRTHIEFDRWLKFLGKIKKAEKLFKTKSRRLIKKHTYKLDKIKDKRIQLSEDEIFLNIKNSICKITLNTRRGLALNSLSFKSHNFVPLIGTIDADYWGTLNKGADYYSGNFINDIGTTRERITDLQKVKPKIYFGKNYVNISCDVQTKYGIIKKNIIVYSNEEKVRLVQNYVTKKNFVSSLRLNNITFLNSIKNSKICFFCKNGGREYEKFFINEFFDHSKPASTFVSNSCGLGCTNGVLKFLIGKRKLNFKWKNELSYVLPMLKYSNINNKKLFRIFFSLKEIDDTSHPSAFTMPFELIIDTKK